MPCRRGPLYMGKMGSICHVTRPLPASIWGHCSQVLVFTSIWGRQKGVWQWHFSCCFSQHLGISGPPNTAKQGKTQNDKSTLFCPPTEDPFSRREEGNFLGPLDLRKAQEGCGGLGEENPGAGSIFQQPFFTPDIPQSEIVATIFLTGRNSGRRIGWNFGRNFLGIFVLHSVFRTTHQNFSPNSSQFITPCLVTAPVTEISKLHLRELLGLGVPNIFLAGKCPNLGRDSISCCRTIGEEFSSSVEHWWSTMI